MAEDKKDNEYEDDLELEDDLDYDDDVDAGAPDVASGKGSKITIIAFAAILISVVLYFLFFSGGGQETNTEGQSVENLQPENVSEAPAQADELEDFNSIFEESQAPTTGSENVILQTPDLPSVPELPDIFGDSQQDEVLPAFLDLPQNNQNNNASGQIVNQPPASPAVPQNPALPGQIPGQVPGQIPGQIPGQVPGQIPGQLPDGIVTDPNNTGAFPGTNLPGGLPQDGNPQTNDLTPSSIIVVSGGPGPTNSVGYENNIISLNKNPIEELEETKPEVVSQYISDRSTTIVQGKIISAVLETAINTEIPGEVRGIISRDVYAESGNHVLIPRGSRIYGSYSGSISRGQARVTISWSRLIRPDGVDASVSFNAADQFGRAGIEGDVDNKYGSIITNSLLTSVLAVGGAIIADKLSDTSTTTTTSSDTGNQTTTGSAVGQAVTDVSKTVVDTVGEIVNNTINLDPVIRIPQGTKITIVVNSDMSLPYYKK